MEKPICAPFDPRPALPPRFSLGRGVGYGLVACLSLWTSVGALAATKPEAASPSAYREALESFHQQNYERVLTLTERSPENASNGERADILNLRGAVFLRQGRYDQARVAFGEATRLDPKLWAARFNEAEVSFREKHYTASSEQFDILLDRTSRFWHPEEHRFLEYKLLLADLCAGQEQPVLDFIAAHRADPAPPLAWYYLNAALEERHDRPQKADEWLAQADAKHGDGSREVYAESFARLGWTGESPAPSERLAAGSTRRVNRRVPESTEAATVVRGAVLLSRGNRESAAGEVSARAAAPANIALVQLLPGTNAFLDGKDRNPVINPKDQEISGTRTTNSNVPSFRYDGPPVPADSLPAADVPPSRQSLFPDGGNAVPADRGGAGATANLLAKPRHSRSTPTPTPTPEPSETPDTQSANASPAANASPTPVLTATPSPDASPASTPSPEFLQKYEAAYVSFLKKDYPTTILLLDEADKIQPKQPQSTTLRGQVFKQEYEGAYLAFRKTDYPGALALLDQADTTKPNYPDAINLRGLVYSKQHEYDQAEKMFKKAIELDPTLWAAKFNYAELPFNRGDYTTARSRFEDLLGETDTTKLPREAELAQYKVFLTLLLEGKTDQARSFMEHFNFSGSTPAKYFCNAAMQFRAGSTDKAMGWINSAKKEYPSQLVTIFVESFYRLGWMTDPNAVAPGAAVAAASPAVSPAVEAIAPSVAPALSPAAGQGTNIAVASVTPTLSPAASPILLAASSPSASGVPVVAAVSPGVAMIPAASPSGSVLPAASPLVATNPGPASTANVTPSPEVPTASETATPSQEPVAKTEEASDDLLRWSLVGAVLLYGVYVLLRALRAASRRKNRRMQVAFPTTSADGQTATEPEKIETPR